MSSTTNNSKTKKFRSRATTASSDEEGDEGRPALVAKSSSSKTTSKTKDKSGKKEGGGSTSTSTSSSSKKPSTLLSFDDDEDEDGGSGSVQILKSKKKALSKKPLRRAMEYLERENASAAAAAAASSDASTAGGASGGAGGGFSSYGASSGEYTAERMAALKKGQNFQVSTKAARETEKSTRVTFVVPEREGGRGEEGEENEEDDDEEGGIILDKAEVERLKKEKRRKEHFGELGGSGRGGGEGGGGEHDEGEDYIALDGSRKGPPGEESRSKAAAAALKAAGPLDQAIEDDWESEIIRRGARRGTGGGGTGTDLTSFGSGGGLSSSLGRIGMHPLSTTATAPFKTVEAVLKDLRSTKTRVEEAHTKNERAAEKARSELIHVKEGLGKLQHEFDDTAARFSFFQEVREYISSLCGCLREKEGMVGELERAMAQVRRDMAEKRWGRRREGQEDEMEAVFLENEGGGGQWLMSLQGYVPTVVKGLKVLGGVGEGGGGGGGGGGMVTQVEEQGQQGGGMVVLDEFGRDTSDRGEVGKERRRKEQKHRREKVLAKINAAGGGGVRAGTDTTEAEATFSGAEDSDTEVEVAGLRQAKLLEAAQVIFEDVADEYGSLEPVASRFELWKKTYPKDYHTAYVSAALPQIFEPFVRLEMARWDPLEGEGEVAVLEAFPWFERLFRYAEGVDGEGGEGRGGEGEGAATAAASQGEGEKYPPEEDPDDRLVPTLVEKVAVARLQSLLAECYDPLSFQQTRRAVAAVQAMLIYEPGKHALEHLLQAPLDRLKHAITQTCVPLLRAGASSAAVSFQRRQIFVAVKLYRNTGAWHEVLAPRVLAPLVLSELLEGMLVPALENRLDNATAAGSGGYAGQDHATLVEVLGTMEALLSATMPSLLLEKSVGPLKGTHRLLDKLGQAVGTGPLADTVVRLRLAFGGAVGGGGNGGNGGGGEKKTLQCEDTQSGAKAKKKE